MYSSKSQMADFEHRVRMCELSFLVTPETTAKVKVCTVEKDLLEKALQEHEGEDAPDIRPGSIDVIRYLKVSVDSARSHFRRGAVPHPVSH
jgi:hypothetical protein